MEWSRKTQDLSKQGRHIIRHPVANHLPSSNSSGRNLLCGLSQFWSWHGPHAAVHGSPYLLQEQRNVLQALEQLQWMIFKRLSGAAVICDIIGISWSFCMLHPQFTASMSSCFPVQVMSCAMRQWNLVADSVGGRRYVWCYKRRRSDNFPAESVISHCC